MRNIILLLLLFISVHIGAANPLRIGVISDTHYLSEQLMDKGYAIQDYAYTSGREVLALPEILEQVISDYKESKIEVLLICGDMTKDGEKQSHIDFKEKLMPLLASGVKVFVIPGNHDLNMPNAIRYEGNKTFKVENTSPIEFQTIYHDFGYKQAISRDANSLSYVAPMDENTWLLAIDAARYEEYQTHAISAGRIKKETEEWMLWMLQRAKDENKNVIAMMHWGVVEHIPMQAFFFKNYLVDEHKRMASLLADNGVKLIFTGHFHSNDISKFETAKGNTIYDIETGALTSYPFAYRFVEVGDTTISIKTKNIEETASFPNLVMNNKTVLRRLAQAMALPLLKNKLPIFGGEQLNSLSAVVADLFILHLYGDEIIDQSIKDTIINVFRESEFPIDDDLNNLNIELAPLDNNIMIILN